ncbi:hypothetical protein Cfor_10268 [Coptotermes formosanus]|uniref:Endonuclease/exonuclease/phosphatase domain-containing protein n=1 Tax=Coptotermes formosanus TaxID=36987 RepID=A0A6L2PE68_COPFO|nr:hypothetical protein Cfor_10268 [Coptotermes formosanus]
MRRNVKECEDQILRTIIHRAVSFQIGGRKLLTLDQGTKITMSSLLPEDRKALFRLFYVSLINAYAHTEDKDSEHKEKFYQILEKLNHHMPSNDIKIIIGDLNAQTGQEEVFLEIIGKHSMHKEINDNGIRLIEFVISIGMVISSTTFPHEDIHKQMCTSPYRVTKNSN